MLSGTGSPEGAQIAAIGQQYVDDNATRGAVYWIKESGTGSTGWRLLWGDTGWRDVTSLLTPTPSPMTGSLYLRRQNDRVIFRVNDLANGQATNYALASMGSAAVPTGFHPAAFRVVIDIIQSNSIATRGWSAVDASGTVWSLALGATNTWVAGLAGRGEGSWVTTEAWPATLPGSPA